MGDVLASCTVDEPNSDHFALNLLLSTAVICFACTFLIPTFLPGAQLWYGLCLYH